MGLSRNIHSVRSLVCAFLACAASLISLHAQTTQAVSVPILRPAGLAFDGHGDLYVAESAAHLVLHVSASGAITVAAGTGAQGYAGDGGPATAALLDTPSDLSIDSAGNLYIADTHNHVIRRVDEATHTISTVAGTGLAGRSADGTVATQAPLDTPMAIAVSPVGDLYIADTRNHAIRLVDHLKQVMTTIAGGGTQGYSGDGGPALGAQIDSPSGLALDGSGNLLIADTHNQRVRRVDVKTGIITNVAGTGASAFSSDHVASTAAALNLPHGITVDSSGNLYVADMGNHRIRRVDAVTGLITTVAGEGTEAYAGDNSLAVTASLDSPRSVVLSPGGLPTLADTANQRVRQVDSAAVIHTIAGLGLTQASTLLLTGPSTIAYGSGSVLATLAASPATGPVTFLETSGALPQTLSSVLLTNNTAALSTREFNAGGYHLEATYPGDASHTAAQSSVLALTIAPAVVIASPAPIALLYGQQIPALTGTFSGVLPQDTGKVSVSYATAATAGSHPAAYPISASLSGSAAGNYSLSTAPAAVTISKASATLVLGSAGTALFTVHVASNTTGTPTGSVSLLDGQSSVASATLSPTGDVSLTPSLSAGSHTLTASYSGDVDFLTASSAATVVTVAPAAVADFSLTATGQTNLTVPGGTSASFSFATAPINGSLSSPIELSVAGLPPGATASFTPAYLPPGGTINAFILSVQTVKLAQATSPGLLPLVLFAVTLPLLWVRRRRLRGLLAAGVAVVTVVSAVGCGDRVNTSASANVPLRTYTLTVTGTATSVTGATLRHSATVTLNLQ